jgi:hypothetical protein
VARPRTLSTLPIVARVSTGLASPGGPKPADVVRELAVASHAARLGAPVVPPADEIDPGPHWRGHVVTFWRYIRSSGEVDGRAAGRALRAVHDALVDYDGRLPAAGHPEDLDEMLATLQDSERVEFVRELASRWPDLDGQALHGDAHLGNCLASEGGPLWHDFETACRGPREYDLAALVLRDLAHGEDRWRGTRSPPTVNTTRSCSTALSRSMRPGSSHRCSPPCLASPNSRRSSTSGSAGCAATSGPFSGR